LLLPALSPPLNRAAPRRPPAQETAAARGVREALASLPPAAGAGAGGCAEPPRVAVCMSGGARGLEAARARAELLAALPPHELILYTTDEGSAPRVAALAPHAVRVARDAPLPVPIADGPAYVYGAGAPLQRLAQLWHGVDECFRLIQASLPAQGRPGARCPARRRGAGARLRTQLRGMHPRGVTRGGHGGSAGAGGAARAAVRDGRARAAGRAYRGLRRCRGAQTAPRPAAGPRSQPRRLTTRAAGPRAQASAPRRRR
jgi:hypothetical protein